jgi:hypothetical protein
MNYADELKACTVRTPLGDRVPPDPWPSAPREVVDAGYDLVSAMVPYQNQPYRPTPQWYGWAIRNAYIAGRREEAEKHK